MQTGPSSFAKKQFSPYAHGFICNCACEMLEWAALEARIFRFLRSLACAWRSLSMCATTAPVARPLYGCAPHELERFGFHCSCSFSRSHLSFSLDASSSLCGSLSLSLPALSRLFSLLLGVSLNAQFSLSLHLSLEAHHLLQMNSYKNK